MKFIKKVLSKLENILNKFKWFSLLETKFKFTSILSIFGSIFINLVIFLMNFSFSIYYSSPWYFTFSLYYLFLIIGRILTLILSYKNIKKNKEDDNKYYKNNLKIHLIIGFLNILDSFLIGGITYVVLRLKPPSIKSLVPAITSATYTFYKFTVAIINLVKAKKIKDNITILTFKEIGLIDAIASMLMLEVTMIYANGDFDNMKYVFIISGSVFTIIALIISITMIIRGIKRIKNFNKNLEIEK